MDAAQVIRLIYSAIFYLATPLLVLRLLWRSLRTPDYRRRLRERFARYGNDPRLNEADVIFHAVSVGEVHAALPLIQQLESLYPELSILVTTTTPTGSARVRALLGDRVMHVYLPYDIPGAINRFLDRFEPRLLVIMETEWWPNLMHCCAKRGVKIMLANARLSEKSLRNYKRITVLAGNMLAQFDRVSAQSDFDSERLQSLGLDAEKIIVAGSMKYDLVLDTAQLAQAHQDKSALIGRPVLVAASTRTLDGDSEEEKVLIAFRKLLETHPDLLLILVPRHPERFAAVFAMAEKAGLRTASRSRDKLAAPSVQVLVGDSMGEMQYYYGLADIAFVGGSLVNTGCQNIIEPAAIGLPVISGPSLFNFQAVSDQLQTAGGMLVAADAMALAGKINQLLDNPQRRQAMGDAARDVVLTNQGATARNLEIISELLAGS
jgi:3-deoxy-D-manno-octulosonic-acid transferase